MTSPDEPEDCVGSGTLNHAIQDGRENPSASTLKDMLVRYTPGKEDVLVHTFVTSFLIKWISTCGARCPRVNFQSPVTWASLLQTFAAPLAHPRSNLRWRRSILDRLWWASRESGVYWWAVFRAADYWDIPCLFWHMVYLTHERCHSLIPL
jgi:hypothetical protein